MKIASLASSSAGNSSLVICEDTYLLIDAGISCRRIVSSLENYKVAPALLDAVFITHAHSDHISGLKGLCKKLPIKVFAPYGVSECVLDMIPELLGRITIIDIGKEYAIGNAFVKAFRTPHDASDSVGYIISHEGRTFGIATDMGCITEEVVSNLSGANTVLLEANYDSKMLKYGPYPFQLKNRISSDKGHLSNDMCADISLRLYQKGTNRIILGHMSKENNTPDIARSVVMNKLVKAGASLGGDIDLIVADRCTASILYDV